MSILAEPAVKSPARMGVAEVSAITPIDINGEPTIVKLKLAAGYKAAFVVWDKFGLDIIQWIELRQHARMGVVEVLHLLQQDTNYTPEQIYEAFCSDPKDFEKLSEPLTLAMLKVMGVDEQKILMAINEGAEGGKKKKVRSSSTK